jgi:oligoendopeptidase F
MGKDQLDFWDRNAPLPEAPEECVPWDEAKRIVLESYEKFSPQFSEIAQQFFDNRWIDAGVYEGKDYGAYSHPTATSVHPYIMMNYQCKKQDIMTLAHELGHGVHQFMARENGALMAGTPLTLAETASIFGEQLVFKHLIENETDPKALKIMISKKVEDSLNTIVRQITFHEFEFRVHTERKQGELSPQRINDIWLEVNRECFGLSMKYPDDASVLWSSIPHFIHSPFYVYSYAFGNCLVNSLYAVYESGSVEDFVPKYIDMLKAGGTKKHKEMLAPFGLDASNPSFWQGGLDIISHMIDELAKLD